MGITRGETSIKTNSGKDINNSVNWDNEDCNVVIEEN